MPSYYKINDSCQSQKTSEQKQGNISGMLPVTCTGRPGNAAIIHPIFKAVTYVAHLAKKDKKFETYMQLWAWRSWTLQLCWRSDR